MICCFTVNSFLDMSLPTAGMFIGWLSSIISLIVCGICIQSHKIIEFSRIRIFFISLLIGGSSGANFIPVILSLLDLIASVLLIIGVNKRNHLFLVPWLINSGLFLATKISSSISDTLLVLSNSSVSPGPLVAIQTLFIALFFGMVWNAIYSLFQSIRKQEQEILGAERFV